MSKIVLIKWSAFAGLFLLALSIGCTSISMSDFNKGPNQPDPETGIISWIYAVNDKDLSRLYGLQPDEVKKVVSFSQFETVNKGNAFIAPNSSITSYEILNKTSNATTAHVVVVIWWVGPESPNSTQMQTLPMYFNFQEFFEDGEWKVWTMPWQ